MTPAELLNLATKLQEAVNMIVATVPNEPGPEPEPEPEPVWPTAPLVWHDGEVWVRGDDGEYQTAGDYWAKSHLDSTVQPVRDGARRFVREAIPVTLVPTEAWETWKRATRDLDYTPDCELIDAVDSLAREVGE